MTRKLLGIRNLNNRKAHKRFEDVLSIFVLPPYFLFLLQSDAYRPYFEHCIFNTKRIKVTVQFERCFRLMEHISVISCRNSINLYITGKLIKFYTSLFNLYLVISNK